MHVPCNYIQRKSSVHLVYIVSVRLPLSATITIVYFLHIPLFSFLYFSSHPSNISYTFEKSLACHYYCHFRVSTTKCRGGDGGNRMDS